MFDLIIRAGRLIDPLNNIDAVCDVAVSDAQVACVAPEIEGATRRELDARGKLVIPGIIDMHTHMRTVEGHPHAQRMVALAGVCTTLDMAGPLDDILDSIPTSGSGINVAVVQAARHPQTLQSNRPDAGERRSLIERTLEAGGIGIKLLGGHFPMDLDVSAAFIEDAAEFNAWVAWHVGNTVHGSNIEGLRDAVAAAGERFLHVAHLNSYCRGLVKPEVEEVLEAVELMRAHPNLFVESYLSELNGTRLTIVDGRPASSVTVSCLKKVGCTPDAAGMRESLLTGKAGVLYDNGTVGELIRGPEAVRYWESQKTVATGCFSINPAVSRFIAATAKRADGSFVVDSFSTDGGTYPRNVIVEKGLALADFGAITLREFVVKASLNGARALNLPSKGHLGVGADADVSVLDPVLRRAHATVVGGRIIMQQGRLTGSGTTIICDERGAASLKRRGIACCIKGALNPRAVCDRFVP